MRRAGAIGARLRPSEPLVRIRRRRRSPEHPWAWRPVCDSCGPLGDGWTKSEQAATELGFEHARRHVEPLQLELELEVDGARRRKRRRR